MDHILIAYFFVIAQPNTRMDLKTYIRCIPDFPSKGVLFRDISPLLANSEAFHVAALSMVFGFDINKIEFFAGVESRGFIFASYLAAHFKKGFLPLRKVGKLPPPVASESYSLEYGFTPLETKYGQHRIMILDDVMASGGTLAAAISLCEKAGYTVEMVAVLIDLTNFNHMKFNGKPIHSVIQY